MSSGVSAEQLAGALALLLKSPELLKTIMGSAHVAATEKTKKARKPHDPNAPKRPKNAFFIFLNSVRAEITEKIKAEYPEKKHQERMGLIAKEAKARWEALSVDEKAPFVTEAESDRTRYSEAKKAYQAGGATAGTATEVTSE